MCARSDPVALYYFFQSAGNGNNDVGSFYSLFRSLTGDNVKAEFFLHFLNVSFQFFREDVPDADFFEITDSGDGAELSARLVAGSDDAEDRRILARKILYGYRTRRACTAACDPGTVHGRILAEKL